MRLAAASIVVLALVAGPPGIMAQGKGKPQGVTAQQNVQSKSNDGTNVAIHVSIGNNDERIIREWFSQPTNVKGLPPGLAKKEELPPGLQKHLARNGQLPPGLQKKIQPLPRTLESRLTRLPEGRARFMINGSVILLDQRKQLILDLVAVF